MLAQILVIPTKKRSPFVLSLKICLILLFNSKLWTFKKTQQNSPYDELEKPIFVNVIVTVLNEFFFQFIHALTA